MHIYNMIKNTDKAEEILEEIGRTTEKQFMPIVGRDKGRVLAEIVRQVQPKRVLEIGTLIGYSAILMGRELGRGANLTTIEIDKRSAKLAEKNLKRAELPLNYQVLTGNALQVLPKLEGNFDLVFIDAEKKEYFDYLRLAENRLLQGSVIVADNARVFEKDMGDYLDYVRSSPKYASQYIAVGDDGLEVSLKL